MRVLLIEDDSATAQSIELMLKSESFNVYTTDLGEEGIDLGKIYDYVQCREVLLAHVATFRRTRVLYDSVYKLNVDHAGNSRTCPDA